ncbi:MAG: hypothetical protein HUJ27_15870 [Rhodobacteraceae bacterium]|nr:hypothetical protein [Paracoccaceae bacterium]
MKKRAKILTVTLFAVILVTLVFVSARALESATERRVLHQYLSDALSPVAPHFSSVGWEPATRALVRPFTEYDEYRVGRAISMAWQAHASAMTTGHTDILPDYFSGVALQRAGISARQAVEDGTQMVILRQTARPEMFHLDGSVLQVRSDALVVRYATEGDRLTYFGMGEDRTVTTLMNETTGWRVFSHERVDVAPIQTDLTGSDIPEMAGLNYYPAETPWRGFWPEFDADLVRADLEKIAELGANSVRFFLPRADFLDPEISAGNIAKLETFLRSAEDLGLHTIPTLFDLRPGYAPGTWAEDVRYLETVLPVLQASPSVVLVDLKNEPDLDYPAHGTATVEAWLRTMIAVIRQDAPDLPLTIGWSAASHGGTLVDLLDVVSYHDYAPLEGAAARLDEVRELSGGKRVIVTEIGESSWSVAASFPGSEAAQATRLGDRIEALQDADGIFVWTLHDFADPDASVVGASPWVRGLQSGFGLLADGDREKPAAETVRTLFKAWLSQGATN